MLRELEMEQQELRRREMKINLSINQQERQKQVVRTNRGDSSSVGDKEQELIARDLWKQSRRISIPIFDGGKSAYESWKAVLTACIDQAPATNVSRSWDIQLEPMRLLKIDWKENLVDPVES